MDGAIEQLLDTDPCVLSHDERLDRLAALDRLSARVAARTQRMLAAMHTDPPAMLPGTPNKIRDKAFVREEVACLLRWSPGVSGTRLHEAADLVERLPATLSDLEAGRFSLRHATTLVDATDGLDAATTAAVEARVLPRAGRQTLSEFRASVRRAVQRLDPRPAETKHRDAQANRRVVDCPERDGMAGLYAYLPAPAVQRIMTRINQTADRTSSEDQRSVDQRRADSLVELICGDRDDRRGGYAEVQLTLSLDTLTGGSDEPGELTGYGPLPARIAAELAHDLATKSSTRIRALPLENNQLIAPAGIDDTPTRYQPNRRLHDYVVARDQTCRFTGCRRNAARCEIDHVIPFDGTNTTAANLHALCPGHHHLKHEAGWQVIRAPDGTTHWMTPTGRHYPKPPDERPTAP